MRTRSWIGLLVGFALTIQAFGWGADGHRISGLIAERYLTPKSKAAIQQLLGHSKLETTQIYTEVSIKLLQEVHARTHPAAALDNLPHLA